MEISTERLTYINAGHNPPLVRHAGEDFAFLKNRSGFILAGMDGTRNREFELELHKGYCLYLYAVGVAEATDARDQLYGEDRLQAMLDANASLPAGGLLPAIRQDIDRFVKEIPQFDDITMMALETKMRGVNVKHISVPAAVEQLPALQAFITEELEAASCPQKATEKIQAAAEEIFINIARRYACHPQKGTATVRCAVGGDPLQVTIQCLDQSRPFNPLKKGCRHHPSGGKA